MSLLLNLFKLCCFASIACFALGATKNKRHGHNGTLEVYDGKLISFKVTPEQEIRLDKGEPVTFNERSGKSGRGVVIQDVNASTIICMDKIRDLNNYPKMVAAVKSVEIYDNLKFINGTSKTAAKFEVGVLGMSFGYFLLLTHEPKYNTLTWTLDYKYNSDFDDNVGHWQVMKHPTKSGWARVLYSTKVKLFPWIPEFIVNFLTGKALVESTTWVRKESEAEAKRQEEAGPVKGKIGFNFNNPMAGKSLPKWMMKGGKSDDIEKEGIEHNDRAENRNAVGLKPLKSWFRLPRGGCF